MRRDSQPDSCLWGCERNTLTIAKIIETNCLAHSTDIIVPLPWVNMTFLQLDLNGPWHIAIRPMRIVRPTPISRLGCLRPKSFLNVLKIRNNTPVPSEAILEWAKVVMGYLTMILHQMCMAGIFRAWHSSMFRNSVNPGENFLLQICVYNAGEISHRTTLP